MAKSEETLQERFRELDSKREAKLQRARYASSLTIPSLLPPRGSTEQNQVGQTYSSVSSRGVTSMASRILAAMLPLNDAPFFSFSSKMGTEMSAEVWNYLDALSYQVHRKLSSKNLREVIFLQQQLLELKVKKILISLQTKLAEMQQFQMWILLQLLLK